MSIPSIPPNRHPSKTSASHPLSKAELKKQEAMLIIAEKVKAFAPEEFEAIKELMSEYEPTHKVLVTTENKMFGSAASLRNEVNKPASKVFHQGEGG